MSSTKTILGHIDCPTCGTPKGMRVTPDKNGEPFGYCGDCAQQLRVGGDRHRVGRFLARHGLAQPTAAPVSVPVPGAAPAPAPAAAPKAAPAPEPVRPRPARTSETATSFFEHLMGVGKP